MNKQIRMRSQDATTAKKHLSEYADLLLKLETKPDWRKIKSVEGFELLEIRRLLDSFHADQFKLRFVSCMPRSGSTLLCNILAQNPRFHATPTSGLNDVLLNIKTTWDGLIEHKAAPDEAAKRRVLLSAARSYHGQDKIVFDKCRGWLTQIEMMEELTGERAKVLCTVRPIPEILASMEKVYRRTTTNAIPGETENYFKFQTIEGRCEYWLRDDQMVGLMINRIRDAVDRGLSDRILFVEYQDLTALPAETMQKIYDFIGEPFYDHDFDNVKQVTHENDDIYGYVGLHDIRNKVEYSQSDATKILGKRLCEKYNFSLFQ